MENTIDSILDNLFSNFQVELNILLGILFIFIGLFLSLKKPITKGRKISSFVCIILGSLGTLSGILQFLI
jgi:hypothetical protein